MEAAAVVQVEELTSGASGRLIPVFRNLRRSISSHESMRRSFAFIYSFFLWIVLLLPRLHKLSSTASMPPSPPIKRKIFAIRRDHDDTIRRRDLAYAIPMVAENDSECNWATSLFQGVRRHALFYRSWFPKSGGLKGILIIIHGLNEHSGRYGQFAKQLISCNFGVLAMDWIGHGGSDGLHGYVPSLDYVVADTVAFLDTVKSENPGVPCFLFGHSTGGAVVLKAALYPHVKEILEGVILTSPALRVKPAHPIVGAVAPIFSMVAPRFQFKNANKRGIPVSRDPAALIAKYSDPLVYTGPIRIRTGHEILRISSYLMRNLKSISVSFFVLHGTADRVTDPQASKDLYSDSPSKIKDIKLYNGYLHDLLFEPERKEIGQDIINWMEKRISVNH